MEGKGIFFMAGESDTKNLYISVSILIDSIF